MRRTIRQQASNGVSSLILLGLGGLGALVLVRSPSVRVAVGLCGLRVSSTANPTPRRGAASGFPPPVARLQRR